jgi:hypothetical protein
MRKARIAPEGNVVKKVLKKRLRLEREVVATLVSELTAAELRQVAGGAPHKSGAGDDCSGKPACTIPGP